MFWGGTDILNGYPIHGVVLVSMVVLPMQAL